MLCGVRPGSRSLPTHPPSSQPWAGLGFTYPPAPLAMSRAYMQLSLSNTFVFCDPARTHTRSMGLSLTCAPGFVFCDPARTRTRSMVLSLTCAPGRSASCMHRLMPCLWRPLRADRLRGGWGPLQKGSSRRILPDLSSRFLLKTGLFLVYSTIAEIRDKFDHFGPLWWGDLAVGVVGRPRRPWWGP